MEASGGCIHLCSRKQHKLKTSFAVCTGQQYTPFIVAKCIVSFKHIVILHIRNSCCYTEVLIFYILLLHVCVVCHSRDL